MDEWRHRLRQHPRDPRRHRPHQRGAVRADRDARGPARDIAGGVRPDEPGRYGRGDRPDGRGGDPPDGRLPQRQGLPPGAPRPGRADRLRGLHRRLQAGRHVVAPYPPGRGLHRLGRPARRVAPGQRRQHRPARSDDSRHRRGRRIDVGRPAALRRHDDRRDHAVQARSRRLRPGGPAAPDDPRRPGGDGHRIGPPPQPDPGPRPGAPAACST